MAVCVWSGLFAASRDIAKNANKARLYERLRDAELYQKTGKLVDQLAGKLKIH